jgi:ferritin-like metal-binding protein YciE
MDLITLNDLFLHELQDLYDAEKQLVDALPQMATSAANPELRDAFLAHLQETQGHVQRLESVFDACGEKPKRESCKGMEGLIKEGAKLLHEKADSDVKDAGLISSAQRVEHYEIAAYGTLVTWCGMVGLGEDVLALLKATLSEEKHADEKLSQIAESSVNEWAAQPDGNSTENPPERRRRQVSKKASRKQMH